MELTCRDAVPQPGRHLRILAVEDSDTDTDVLLLHLTEAGFSPSCRRVCTAREMEDALGEDEWDIIISDFEMPGFDGLEALEVARRMRPYVPFIILSGAIGEETAAEAMKRGASDFIMKGNTARLAPVILRELAEAERRRERQRLSRQLRLFRSLLDNCSDSIFLICPDSGEFVDVNEQACRKLGYERSLIEQMKIQDIQKTTPSHLSWRETVEQLRKHGTVVCDAIHHPATGEAFPVEVSLTFLSGEEGDFVVAIARDTTERCKAEDLSRELDTEKMVVGRLREIDRLKDQFVETVTHELRTPMTALLSAIQMLVESATGLSEDQKTLLDMMQRNVDRLSRFATDVLLLSRIESGRQALHPSHLGLQASLSPTVRLLMQKASEHGATIELDVPEKLSAWGDRDALAQIVTNLVTNAIVHNRDGVTVRVSARGLSDGSSVEVSVSDDGDGIAPEALDRLCDRFYQAHRQSGPGYRGMGLGLSISKALAENMGGKMTIASELGKGTTFRFSLPVNESFVNACDEDQKAA